MASFMRIAPEHGVIEIGRIWFGPPLQRTRRRDRGDLPARAARVRRARLPPLEWKCDALNAASRRAAERFGFRFEGVFRDHMVVKGRNRDTAWYAITDDDWPAHRARLRAPGSTTRTSTSAASSARRSRRRSAASARRRRDSRRARSTSSRRRRRRPSCWPPSPGWSASCPRRRRRPTAELLRSIVASPACRLLLARDEAGASSAC